MSQALRWYSDGDAICGDSAAYANAHGRAPNIWPQARLSSSFISNCNNPPPDPHTRPRSLPISPPLHLYNAAQTTHNCLHRRSDKHTHIHTCANQPTRSRQQKRRARHPPGRMEQIHQEYTAAGKTARHVHGLPDCSGRAAVLVCGVSWELCMYTPTTITTASKASSRN